MNEKKVLMNIGSPSLESSVFNKFERYLEDFELPIDNVIASSSERNRIMNALPDLLEQLPPEQRRDARYLSKFVAGIAVGLFDASLNFVWNEVILCLRKKVILYGLDYFFDNAVGGTLREHYRNEEDLSSIKDKTLLDSCKKMELISDVLHRKLSHILDMRNQIGSSHPTEYSINAYELLGWLQTCIQDVFMDKISDSAITVKKIVDNVKQNDEPIDEVSITQFEKTLKTLSPNMISNLLTTLFGIFVSTQFSKKQRKLENIMRISKVAWQYGTDKAKYELGEKIDSYRGNLDSYKTERAELFFSICEGERYYSNDTRTVKLTLLCEQLQNVHGSWDNYIHEIPVARDIMAMIPSVSDIPSIRLETVIRIFLVCRIGKNISYCDGVSLGACQYYDKFFQMLDQKTVLRVVEILGRDENRSLLYGSYRKKHIQAICEMMKSDLLTDRGTALLDYIIGFKGETMEAVFKTTEFKDIKNGLF